MEQKESYQLRLNIWLHYIYNLSLFSTLHRWHSASYAKLQYSLQYGSRLCYINMDKVFCILTFCLYYYYVFAKMTSKNVSYLHNSILCNIKYMKKKKANNKSQRSLKWLYFSVEIKKIMKKWIRKKNNSFYCRYVLKIIIDQHKASCCYCHK